MIFGYVSEYKLRKIWFNDDRISNLTKYDDHDRKKKGDLSFIYKGVEIRVEVKSLQTSTIRHEKEQWSGKFQCDASDRREVRLPNGKRIQTTCLVVGEFDLLAVNLFSFGDEWRFGFAKNRDLPRSSYSKYRPQDRKYLLATLMAISWPLSSPFSTDPFPLLDSIVREKRGRS